MGDRLKGPTGAVDFRTLFLVPSALALVAAAVLFFFFRPPDRMEAEAAMAARAA